MVQEIEERKKEKATSLKEFVEENHRLITVIGVMGGLSALFTKVGDPQTNPTAYSIASLLSFFTFAMMILLAWELWKQFPKSEKASFTITVFESLAVMFVFALGGYLLFAYPTVVQTFVVLPIFAIAIYLVLYGAFTLVNRKLKAYTYIRKIVPEGTKYSSIKRGVIAALIISPLFIVSILLAQYLGTFIQSIQF